MYRLYLVLKIRKEPPTPEELAIACGETVLDATMAAQYVAGLEAATTNIVAAFNRQAAKDKVCSFRVQIQVPFHNY